MLNQRLFSRPIAKRHSADMGNRHMRFIDDKQKIRKYAKSVSGGVPGARPRRREYFDAVNTRDSRSFRDRILSDDQTLGFEELPFFSNQSSRCFNSSRIAVIARSRSVQRDEMFRRKNPDIFLLAFLFA